MLLFLPWLWWFGGCPVACSFWVGYAFSAGIRMALDVTPDRLMNFVFDAFRLPPSWFRFRVFRRQHQFDNEHHDKGHAVLPNKTNGWTSKQASNRTRTKPSHLQFEPSNWRFSSHSWVLSLVVRERLRTCSPSSPRPVVLVTKFLVYLDSSMSFTFCVIFLFSHKERDNENFREDWVAAWSGGRGFRNEYKQIQWKS